MYSRLGRIECVAKEMEALVKAECEADDTTFQLW